MQIVFIVTGEKSLPQSPTKNPHLQPSNQGKCIAPAGHCNAPEIPCKKLSHISSSSEREMVMGT